MGSKISRKFSFFCQKNATLGSRFSLTKKNGNFVSALMILFLYSKKSRTYLVSYNLVREKFGALIRCHLMPSYSSVNSTNIIIRVAQCNERWSATDSNLNSIWPEKPSRPGTGQDRHNCIKKTEESGKTCKVHSQHLYVIDHGRGNSFKTKPEKVQ